jgi:hypothetical protein
MVSAVLVVPSVVNRWVPHPWFLRVRFSLALSGVHLCKGGFTRQAFSCVSCGRLLRRAGLDATHSSVYAIPQFLRPFPPPLLFGQISQ